MTSYTHSPKTLVRSVRKGSTPMDAFVTDYYRLEDGRYVRHQWAMGGEDWMIVAETEATGREASHAP